MLIVCNVEHPGLSEEHGGGEPSTSPHADSQCASALGDVPGTGLAACLGMGGSVSSRRWRPVVWPVVFCPGPGSPCARLSLALSLLSPSSLSPAWCGTQDHVPAPLSARPFPSPALNGQTIQQASLGHSSKGHTPWPILLAEFVQSRKFSGCEWWA